VSTPIIVAEISTPLGTVDAEIVLGSRVGSERDLIRTRTADGRSRAEKRGHHRGRPP